MRNYDLANPYVNVTKHYEEEDEDECNRQLEIEHFRRLEGIEDEYIENEGEFDEEAVVDCELEESDSLRFIKVIQDAKPEKSSTKGDSEIKESQTETLDDDQDTEKVVKTIVRRTPRSLAEYVKPTLTDYLNYLKKEKRFVMYSAAQGRWTVDDQDHFETEVEVRKALEGIDLAVDAKDQEKMIRYVEQANTPKSVVMELRFLVEHTELARFDQQHDLLGVENGVIDLKTGNFREGRQTDYITKCAGVAYDPTATCPQWERFVHEILCEDQALISYLQVLVGYLLLGNNPMRKLFVMIGRGSNGKSVLLNVLEALFGEYSRPVPLETLIKMGKKVSVGNDLIYLLGARLLTSRELENDTRLATGTIKAITGNDSQAMRLLFNEFQSGRITGKIVIATNELPEISNSDKAAWDRLHLIPFNYSVPEEKQDTHLESKLLKEPAGILNWSLVGLKRYFDEGFVLPECMTSLKEQMREQISPVQMFINAYYVETNDQSAMIKSKPLWEHYLEWASTVATAPHYSSKTFSNELLKLGFIRSRPHGSVFNLKLKEPESNMTSNICSD
ncbi:phage/plasmid primase, P4 family [Lamprobacter modestohalophilus]|uniref:DNA primase family protein n=1 Tax=Lamprobacter modestohalophilus TaxID=1064514 RepID=UPI002ADEF4C3|nr:phage/plasmid primase, P4 family [Lamprobacter modestohalophilus]MEA1048393.1 phage/plasmid primase, P4 family [Lamprobacter modestohalophilus]